ncbi:MAG: hypothetical protein IJZ26_02335, partial [Clostridia bacterium]|nr:hypothetical protein [Clostridia bacterium]
MNFVLLAFAIVCGIGSILLIKKLSNKTYKKISVGRIIMVCLCGAYILAYILRLFTYDFFSKVSAAAGSEIFSNGQI